MSNWIDVAASGDVPLNATKIVTVAAHRLILVRSESGLFALEDKCPHQEQSLDGGLVSPKAVECPWHSVKIELASGKILNDMGFLGLPQVKVFPTQEVGGKIQVDIS